MIFCCDSTVNRLERQYARGIESQFETCNCRIGVMLIRDFRAFS
jgi:hypothetical protein